MRSGGSCSEIGAAPRAGATPRPHARARPPRSLLAVVAVVLGACAPPPELGMEKPQSAVPPQRFSVILEETLVPRCATAGCHAGEGSFAPRLDPEVAFDALVNVSSGQASMPLVDPFAPENSYLILKMRDTAGSIGGTATPMPIGETLGDDVVAPIEAWIANGAPND
jgi:hypothetical protein